MPLVPIRLLSGRLVLTAQQVPPVRPARLVLLVLTVLALISLANLTTQVRPVKRRVRLRRSLTG